MPSYRFTEDAEQDLREVAGYTVKRWGREMLYQYRDGLKRTFEAIAANEIPRRSFSKAFPDLMVTKYRYHYIFYLTEDLTQPVIVGVIHERRDIVSRLGERLA